ncbi:MAG: hypothetical protein IPK72_21220 [Candidatus Eisenbacteria bacterium]|nr:hypothetical protein [Candidatus Eisenbacteria bacterium]
MKTLSEMTRDELEAEVTRLRKVIETAAKWCENMEHQEEPLCLYFRGGGEDSCDCMKSWGAEKLRKALNDSNALEENKGEASS